MRVGTGRGIPVARKATLLTLIGLSALVLAIPDFGAEQDRKMAAEKLAANPISLEPILTTGLTSPIFVTTAHDGTNRLFIVEQAGPIRVLQPGATSPTLFLDLTAKVLIGGGERGMLGMAFHPNFAGNRRFFVTYTQKPDGTVVLAEYLVSSSNPNLAETTEKVILAIPHPTPIHNGGPIEFGPDNFLYIGLGEGGAPPGPDNPAQSPDHLAGKILRIDIDNPESPSQPYSSPASNPFFGSIPGRDEIFALGMRNPWRFSFDRVTGTIYLGDVGYAEREEIDIVTLGGNYGWSVFEGTLCTNTEPGLCTTGTFIPPIVEYTHVGHCAIIGGYVYRGNRSSLPLGSYVYGDHCSGEIFLLETGTSSVLLDTTLTISSFGEDENGEIYVVEFSGAIFRIINAVNPVSLDIQMSQASYVNGQTVTATEFRMKNPGTASVNPELKVWLTIPGIAPISILNLGADGSFVIPPGTDQNLGPLALFTIDSSFPRGAYQFNSRMLDPVTGNLKSEDINTFAIQ